MNENKLDINTCEYGYAQMHTLYIYIGVLENTCSSISHICSCCSLHVCWIVSQTIITNKICLFFFLHNIQKIQKWIKEKYKFDQIYGIKVKSNEIEQKIGQRNIGYRIREGTWEVNSLAEMAARAAVSPAKNAHAYPFLFLPSIAFATSDHDSHLQFTSLAMGFLNFRKIPKTTQYFLLCQI